MRYFFVLFLTLLITRYISEGVYSWIGLDYRWFESEFDLLLLLADFGIFVAIYMVVYNMLRRLMIKKEE
ncbi:hypothetical protein ACFOZY_15290 [Chungangia koreensis]|uniref:Uncharacterized protein n=1 Tax=Chungangia koreensis TaxID=752657 RepID=A0ABV8X920_9LACT